MPGQIPSLYNFVPLSGHVFFPDGSEKVSHDVPFSDGICGHFQIRVTAESPLYIRNGGDFDRDREIGELKRLPGETDDAFRRRKRAYTGSFRVIDDGHYAIPGSSLRGVVRNVVEIAAFGKMCRVDDRRYAVRDLKNPNKELYVGWMTSGHPANGITPKPRAGWLTQSAAGEWEIEPCDFARIEASDLESFHGGIIDLHSRQSAVKKYSQWKKPLGVDFDLSTKQPPHNHDWTDRSGRTHVLRLNYELVDGTTLGNGSRSGVIVLTGQPQARHPGERKKKHLEFIFHPASGSGARIPVPSRKAGQKPIREDFEFIHTADDGKPNPEWGYWKARLADGQPVPVFFLLDNSGDVDSLGLALMYRLPYKHSIHQTLGHTASGIHLSHRGRDLAEAVFGRVQKWTGDSAAPVSGPAHDELRGRISFETLILQGTASELGEKTTLLGSPKPSYYPTYIAQPTDGAGTLSGHYRTYMDVSAELSGWKRYPASNPTQLPMADPSRTTTTINPLDRGAAFTGRIHVHNLRPFELGALVWALTWGGNPKLRHRIGMAKPFGYGLVRIEIVGGIEQGLKTVIGEAVDLAKCQRAFIETMDGFHGGAGKWLDTAQMRNLLVMADPFATPPTEQRYPRLAVGDHNYNEFGDLKSDSAILPRFVDEHPQGGKQKTHPLPPGPKTPAKAKAKPQPPEPPAEPPPKPAPRFADVRVIDKKVKAGKTIWIGRIEGGRDHESGPIVGPLPPDIARGQVIPRMRVKNPQPNNHNFEWVPGVGASGSSA